jgi:hypothetical protein
MSIVIKTTEDESLSDLIKASSDVKLTLNEEAMITLCQKLSYTTWVGYHDSDLVCAWGIIPPSVLSNRVYLWLHTTPKIKECQFVFVRRSQIFIEELLKEYESIVGHVKADAPRSQRWLKWLGAEFSMPKNGMIPFRIRSNG